MYPKYSHLNEKTEMPTSNETWICPSDFGASTRRFLPANSRAVQLEAQQSSLDWMALGGFSSDGFFFGHILSLSLKDASRLLRLFFQGSTELERVCLQYKAALVLPLAMTDTPRLRCTNLVGFEVDVVIKAATGEPST